MTDRKSLLKSLEREPSGTNPLFDGNFQFAFSCILPVFYQHVNRVRDDLVRGITDDFRERQRFKHKLYAGDLEQNDETEGKVRKLANSSGRYISNRALNYSRILNTNSTSSLESEFMDGSAFRAKQEDMRRVLYSLLQEFACHMYDEICKAQDSVEAELRSDEAFTREDLERKYRGEIEALNTRCMEQEERLRAMESDKAHNKTLITTLRKTLYKEVVELREKLYKKNQGAITETDLEQDHAFNVFDWMTILAHDVPLGDAKRNDMLVRMGEAFRQELSGTERKYETQLHSLRRKMLRIVANHAKKAAHSAVKGVPVVTSDMGTQTVGDGDDAPQQPVEEPEPEPEESSESREDDAGAEPQPAVSGGLLPGVIGSFSEQSEDDVLTELALKELQEQSEWQKELADQTVDTIKESIDSLKEQSKGVYNAKKTAYVRMMYYEKMKEGEGEAAEGDIDDTQSQVAHPVRHKSLVMAPVGNITMVFTDVQNSTRQWDSFPDAMVRALNEHFIIIRRCLDACDGYEVKTEGDGVFAAFQDPVNAARFCMMAQLQLLEGSWPDEVVEHNIQTEADGPQGENLYHGLRVRMGFHCGEPICKPDPHSGRMDYFGPPVNKAARVGGAGYGGQIMISGEVWEVIRARRDEIDIDIVEIDLGIQEFKGLKEAVHCYQILPAQLKNRRFGDVRTGKAPIPHDSEMMKHVLDQHNKLSKEREDELLEQIRKLKEGKSQTAALAKDRWSRKPRLEKSRQALMRLVRQQKVATKQPPDRSESVQQMMEALQQKYAAELHAANSRVEDLQTSLKSLEEQHAELSEKDDVLLARLQYYESHEKEMSQRPKGDAHLAPTGSVTMVFTDVQNSTRQWDSFPDAMVAALNEHFLIIRRCLDVCNGYEVKTEGDGVFAAFGDPVEAAKFCLMAQEELMKGTWPEIVVEHNRQAPEDGPEDEKLYHGLRVRMGFHTGDPICEPDPHSGRMDYFGPPVNRAARVGGAGYGGQILISGESLELIQSRLEDLDEFSVVLTDHDIHQFKGLLDPVHVFELSTGTLCNRRFGEVRVSKPAIPTNTDVVKHVIESHKQVLEEDEETAMDNFHSLEQRIKMDKLIQNGPEELMNVCNVPSARRPAVEAFVSRVKGMFGSITNIISTYEAAIDQGGSRQNLRDDVIQQHRADVNVGLVKVIDEFVDAQQTLSKQMSERTMKSSGRGSTGDPQSVYAASTYSKSAGAFIDSADIGLDPILPLLDFCDLLTATISIDPHATVSSPIGAMQGFQQQRRVSIVAGSMDLGHRSFRATRGAVFSKLQESVREPHNDAVISFNEGIEGHKAERFESRRASLTVPTSLSPGDEEIRHSRRGSDAAATSPGGNMSSSSQEPEILINYKAQGSQEHLVGRERDGEREREGRRRKSSTGTYLTESAKSPMGYKSFDDIPDGHPDSVSPKPLGVTSPRETPHFALGDSSKERRTRKKSVKDSVQVGKSITGTHTRADLDMSTMIVSRMGMSGGGGGPPGGDLAQLGGIRGVNSSMGGATRKPPMPKPTRRARSLSPNEQRKNRSRLPPIEKNKSNTTKPADNQMRSRSTNPRSGQPGKSAANTSPISRTRNAARKERQTPNSTSLQTSATHSTQRRANLPVGEAMDSREGGAPGSLLSPKASRAQKEYDDYRRSLRDNKLRNGKDIVPVSQTSTGRERERGIQKMSSVDRHGNPMLDSGAIRNIPGVGVGVGDMSRDRSHDLSQLDAGFRQLKSQAMRSGRNTQDVAQQLLMGRGGGGERERERERDGEVRARSPNAPPRRKL